jgi:putative flavoprotein involved in K+ transport
VQLDIDAYRNPGGLPDGKILVVGSGQSGCQVAEELVEAGREVFLSCGRAPGLTRRIGDRDIVWWAAETGFLDQTVESLPSPAARLEANILATGHGGGHDLNLRTLRRSGVTLLGRFLGADGRMARFAPNLGESQAWGDERRDRFIDLVRNLVAERGMPMPEIDELEPFDPTAPETLDLAGFGAVLHTGGFRPDFGFVRVPDAFDDMGFPLHADGHSAAVKGLYFVGVHFLRKRKSSIFYGVGEDAALVAGQIAGAR